MKVLDAERTQRYFFSFKNELVVAKKTTSTALSTDKQNKS